MHDEAAQAGPAAEDPRPVRVRVLTRVGCHLCETAEQVVGEVCGRLDVRWETVDIDAADDADDLLDEHGEEIPVTFVDGRMHDYWRVDPARLEAALRAPAPGQEPSCAGEAGSL